MRVWLHAHAHSAAAFMLMLLIIGGLGSTVESGQAAVVTGLPAAPIDLPPAEMDADRDTYGDDVDFINGDAHVRLELQRLDTTASQPYFVVGTQDDQWRFGEGRALEWPHVVDPDPLGHRTASVEWHDHAVRTGAWWYSIPMEGEHRAIAQRGALDEAVPANVEWPQVFHVNVRDDIPVVDIEVQLVDADPSPHELVASWDVRIDLRTGAWSLAGTPGVPAQSLDTIAPGAQITAVATVTAGIDRVDQETITARWAPDIHFDSGEIFYPLAGDVLEQFHGFSRRGPDAADLRTWTRSFDNGRDQYVLLLADYNGDGDVDHEDVAIMSTFLRRTGESDQIYAHVFPTTGDRIVVQYWFLYMYNFVEDVAGDPVERLAHKGDREFIQLTFPDLQAALNGTPERVSYSQHYRGIRLDDPLLDMDPFVNGTLQVYPARGAHASYPVPGDDRRFRNAFAGYGDLFDGEGETWQSGNYTIEILDQQDWAFGHLWAPHTRHSRDLGTSRQPLLIYDFRYPFIDPIPWERELMLLEQPELRDLYGSPP